MLEQEKSRETRDWVKDQLKKFPKPTGAKLDKVREIILSARS